jgi:hypothetical protein
MTADASTSRAAAHLGDVELDVSGVDDRQAVRGIVTVPAKARSECRQTMTTRSKMMAMWETEIGGPGR